MEKSCFRRLCPEKLAVPAKVLLGVFASNSINILAGVNGLEAGQTFIIACAVLLHNLMQARIDQGSCSTDQQLARHAFFAARAVTQSVFAVCAFWSRRRP